MSTISLLPDYVGIVQDTSLDFYNNSTNLLNTMGNYLAEINENIKFNKSLVTTNVLSAYTLLYNELNSTNFTVANYNIVNGQVTQSGVKPLDNQFVLYFVEKYLSLTESYKTTINKGITNNSYFAPFSDDIGCTIETSTILDDNTVPYFDIFTTNKFYPINIPTTLLNKVSLNEKLILKTFSFYTDPLLRQNLLGLQNGTLNDNTAQTSHGQNLINDVLYYKRAVNNHTAFMTEMHVVLNVIADFILFFESLNPRDQDPARKAVFYKYTITNMENLQVQVDALSNFPLMSVCCSSFLLSMSICLSLNLASIFLLESITLLSVSIAAADELTNVANAETSSGVGAPATYVFKSSTNSTLPFINWEEYFNRNCSISSLLSSCLGVTGLGISTLPCSCFTKSSTALLREFVVLSSAIINTY